MILLAEDEYAPAEVRNVWLAVALCYVRDSYAKVDHHTITPAHGHRGEMCRLCRRDGARDWLRVVFEGTAKLEQLERWWAANDHPAGLDKLLYHGNGPEKRVSVWGGDDEDETEPTDGVGLDAGVAWGDVGDLALPVGL